MSDAYADFIAEIEGLDLGGPATSAVLRLGGVLSTSQFRAGQADAPTARFTPDLPGDVAELPDVEGVAAGLEAPDDDA